MGMVINELEQIKHIIECKYYTEIFNAISNYFLDNPDMFCYEGDYCQQYWYEASMRDYIILESRYVTDQGIQLTEIVVEANIEVSDIEDIGLNRDMIEKLRIGVKMDSANLEIVYVGEYMSSF